MAAADSLSSPQFRLLAACARWPRGAERDEGVRRAVAVAERDWPAFLTMVRRHRMAPMALDGLVCAGISPPAELKALAGRDVRQVLGLCAEAARLQALFAAEGIAMAVVKGPALSLLLYGTPGLRQSKDLDVWVSPTDVARAIEQLEAGGYAVIDGPPAPAGPWLDLWLDMRKDSTGRHSATGFVLELHHRLTDNPHVVAQLSLADASREVILGGTVFRTLGEDDLFAYLCTHGTVTRWFRLKWLADIQAMLSGRTAEDIARLYEAARGRDAERAAGLALQLCRRIWGLPLPADLSARLDADQRLARLERGCIAALCGPEFDRQRFGSTRTQLYLWRLKDTWAYRARQLRLAFVDWSLMRRLPLPRPLHVLYLLARPGVWFWRKLNFVAPPRP